MEPRTQRADRWLMGLAVAAGLLLLLGGAVSATSPHQTARPGAEGRHLARDARLVFDLALMTEDGRLLARPRVLGRAGSPLLLTYAGDRPISLGLDPLLAKDGLDLAVDLAVGQERPQRVRVRLPLASRQTVRIPRAGGDLMLAVRALAVDSPEFDAWAARVRRAAPRLRIPEA